MISTPSTGSEGAATAGRPERPQFAADGVALIGCLVGALVAGVATGRWPVPLALVAIAVAAIALDLLRAAFLPGRLWRGRLIVLDFDVFALGMLTGAWAVAGAAAWLAGALGVVAVAVAALGYAFRRPVLTAFMVPGSSPLGIVLALIPALAAIGGGGGIALVRAFPGPAAPTIVMTVVALYVLLFAQAALLRTEVPGWQPPVRPRRRARPRSDTRSRPR